jgi:hypothetical protein
MTRISILTRIAALGALATGVVVVASCDTRLSTAPQTLSSGGPTGSTSSTSNANRPSIVIDSPLVGTLVNLGDSVLVTVALHDSKSSLKNATISGYTQQGSVDLGTFAQTLRYKTVVVPPAGGFRSGLKDTTVRRYLQPINPADTTVDSLIVVVTATDSAGAADTAHVRINIVAGPKVMVVAPSSGDSIPAGVGLSVAARATQPDGVGRIDIRVQGEANWPTRLDTTLTQVYTNAPRDITFSGVASIPINAPLRGKITVTATAVDVNRQPGSSSPVVAFVRAPGAAVPRVTQTVPPKAELNDSVNVRATGQGITTVGVLIRDSTGAVVLTDTVKLTAPFNANAQANVGMNLPSRLQGTRLGITAFAIDQAGRVGYAVPASTQAAQGNAASALVDSTIVVYGHTFALPRQSAVGDITVDAARGNVFLSNTSFNLLELWQSGSKQFAPSGIAVGSLPWGMFVSNSPDTLLVANSGGTNISRVFIGSSDPTQIHEDISHRILTRATYAFTVTESRDQNTGKITLSAAGPVSYSDRPQYIAQSKGGRIFYSTRPTPTAPAGTIRWIDPTQTVSDPHQVWKYGTVTSGTQFVYAIFNVDNVSVTAAPPNSPASDVLTIVDHKSGQATGSLSVSDSVVLNAVTKDNQAGGKVEAALRLDITSLALHDTTFVAASGNRNWIAFGEGHTAGVGRIMMMADSTSTGPNFFSPAVTVLDLTNNASEQVFGVALDATGGMVASHGLQSYFAFVDDPFHLRLQGKFPSASNGAGIAFHPSANGRAYALNTACSDKTSLAFVGSSAGMIEIVDIGHYVGCGRLLLKNSIYGPLRASLPMAGDPPNVLIKLYAITQQGLVVIDLTANDIKPGP